MNEIDKKEFINLYYAIPEEQFELAYAALIDLPFLGITEGFDELIICFLHENNLTELLQTIDEHFNRLHVQGRLQKTEIVQEENWNEQWEQSIEPVIINEHIAIVPEWKQKEIHSDITIIINPKMSFGTGHHQTTRLMAGLLQKTVKPGARWIDAGTGTGILAILAIRLGASHVLAFDNDIWSVNNAEENIQLNNVGDAITLMQADAYTIELPSCHGIAANLHKNILIPFFPHCYQALLYERGDLLISGILRFDVEEIISAAIAAGFEHIETTGEDDWAALHFSAL